MLYSGAVQETPVLYVLIEHVTTITNDEHHRQVRFKQPVLIHTHIILFPREIICVVGLRSILPPSARAVLGPLQLSGMS
jgi:hypothetical protein